MQPDVVVFGAGVVGASVAYHLARRGCSVLVVDRAPRAGQGSTGKATGGFRAQFDSETNVRLSLLSREKLLSFEDETGVDPGYRPHGYLFLACTEEELTTLRQAQAVQVACGLHEATMVSATDARTINPHLGDPSVIGGAFCPTDGFISPMEILRGYLEAGRRLGVRFLFDADVHRTRHDLRAPIFVNAMGAWCGAPVSPVRRNVLATAPTTLLPESMPMTIWSADWYHLRVRDGRVLLLWPDQPVIDDDVWADQVLQKTRQRVPCLRGIPIVERWSGLYEMSPDEHALLGPIGNRTYVANGSSGHGVMHAPALGQLLSEIILDGTASIDVSALDPRRFGGTEG